MRIRLCWDVDTVAALNSCNWKGHNCNQTFHVNLSRKAFVDGVGAPWNNLVLVLKWRGLDFRDPKSHYFRVPYLNVLFYKVGQLGFMGSQRYLDGFINPLMTGGGHHLVSPFGSQSAPTGNSFSSLVDNIYSATRNEASWYYAEPTIRGLMWVVYNLPR